MGTSSERSALAVRHDAIAPSGRTVNVAAALASSQSASDGRHSGPERPAGHAAASAAAAAAVAAAASADFKARAI